MIFVGDIHGEWNYLTSLIRKFNIRNEDIIQVGDWGIGFNSAEKDKRRLRYLNSRPLKARDNKLYIIRGNHDSPSFFDGRYENKFSRISLLPEQ